MYTKILKLREQQYTIKIRGPYNIDSSAHICHCWSYS